MAGPIAADETRVGRVDPSDSQADRHRVAKENPVTQGAVYRVVGKTIGRSLLEIEARVPAENVEDVALGAEVQNQAGAAEGECRRRGAGLGAGRLGPRIDFDADGLAEEVAEPSAAADLVVEVERLVVPGERSEDPDLELVRPLGVQGGGRHG